jgi:predicted MFS family arabinose efflux permease
MSFYMLANPLSVLLSFVLGGWLASFQGWRMTFFLMGIPALFVAALVKLTIRDPRAASTGGPESAAARQSLPSFSRVLADLWHRRAARHLTAALILLLTLGAGLGPWYAIFLTRYHGLALDTLGYSLGLIFSGGGFLGIWLGGRLSGRLFAYDEQRQMRTIALAVAAQFPAFILFLFLRQTTAALGALAVVWMLFNFSIAPTFALLQQLVTRHSRATSIAMVMMLSNLIGMGLGPQIVGLLSDVLRPAFGPDSLRYSMSTLSLVGCWAAYHFWQVGRTVSTDLNAMAVA